MWEPPEWSDASTPSTLTATVQLKSLIKSIKEAQYFFFFFFFEGTLHYFENTHSLSSFL